MIGINFNAKHLFDLREILKRSKNKTAFPAGWFYNNSRRDALLDKKMAYLPG